VKLDVIYDGKTYVYDTDTLTLGEAFSVKAICGLNAGDFATAIFDIHPGAWLAMIVLARRRAGEAVLAEHIDQDKVDVAALAEGMLASVRAVGQDAAGDTE
jgi:hypothetical protein